MTAAFLLLALLAAFHAPLVAAASGSCMDCCTGTMAEMCCPVPGSSSMRSCRGDERDALLSTMSVFLLPGPANPVRPALASCAPAAGAPSFVSQAFSVLDPPPRG